MAGNDKDLEREFDEKFKEKKVGEPFSTDRELVEQGKKREGTNLDLGEERSEEQLDEIEEMKKGSD
ncbi:MAG TPA: hypothetical protein VF832_05875 [Longimicrobiales bacterium]